MIESVERIPQAAEAGLKHPKYHPLVSVITVNFNAGAILVQSVQSTLGSDVTVDIWRGDNGSTDNSLDQLRESVGSDPRRHIIENGCNLGFVRACNILLTQASGDYLLIRNPDTLIKADAVERVVKVLEENPNAGMAGCLIRNPDGTERAGCRCAVPTPWPCVVSVLHLSRLFPDHPHFRDFVLKDEPLPRQPVAVEAISGAFMRVRCAILEDVGSFDDAYFMHCEDLDWCMRVRDAGWQILFIPDVEIVHYKGACGKRRPIFVLWHKRKGMIRFYNKFFRHQYPGPVMLLVTFGVWARFLFSSAIALSRAFIGKIIHITRKIVCEWTDIKRTLGEECMPTRRPHAKNHRLVTVGREPLNKQWTR